MAQLPARRARPVTVLSPIREFEDIYDRMGQLANAAFGDVGFARSLEDMAWTPAADVSEADDSYRVEVDLPGVRRDQVDVQVHDRELVVSGEIAERERGRLHRRTRRTGRFEFRTYLPGDSNAEKVSAEMKDGVLTVVVPKAETAKPRRVEISG